MLGNSNSVSCTVDNPYVVPELKSLRTTFSIYNHG